MGKAVFKQFAAGSCYSYVISSKGEAMVIDPHISLLEDYKEYLRRNRLQLKYIVDTHTHADHFSLAAVLKKELGAKVLMHEKAVSEVADSRLKDGDEISLGKIKARAIYAPGHTDDTVNLYCEGRLFTADVLLIGSVGRTDFQNGSPEAMFDTLQKIKALPDNTIIFPGHDYHDKKSSTIGAEKKANPFMLALDKEAFTRDMRLKKIPKPFNIDNIVRANQKGDAASLSMVTPAEALAAAAKDPNTKLLDVRSTLEFSSSHIKDSLNVPIDTLSIKLNELAQANQSYIVFCRTGNRSPMAADMLMQSGIRNVKVMNGGLTRWQKEKLPVIKGESVISLERQVRIIAGTLVLLGILLAWLVSKAFIFVSIFVACGLIVAGLTDACLMAVLLMKLPYNKKLYKTKSGGGTCAMG